MPYTLLKRKEIEKNKTSLVEKIMITWYNWEPSIADTIMVSFAEHTATMSNILFL